ncbi:MAG: hypothetical protein KA369_08435 [Spirochaetes bacterium]|nr:hypothetical protein [Spirochaetota bacterium]
MKTYIVKRMVEQLFEVEGETKEEALRNIEDPFSVRIISEKIKPRPMAREDS